MLKFRSWLAKRKITENVIAHNPDKKYYYRVHPKGDIQRILKSGLYSVHPADTPGSFVDEPEINHWPDQEPEDPQTSRAYVATSQWELGPNEDRFRIRIPSHYIDDQIEGPDSLGDYYVDTGESEDLILHTNQFDIAIGGRWIRADMVDPIMKKMWQRMYYKSPGYYGNKFNDEPENKDE